MQRATCYGATCFRRLLVWLTSSDERRLHEFGHIPWWEFTQAEGRSPGYQQFLGQGFTRRMVAIRAEEGSTAGRRRGRRGGAGRIETVAAAARPKLKAAS